MSFGPGGALGLTSIYLIDIDHLFSFSPFFTILQWRHGDWRETKKTTGQFGIFAFMRSEWGRNCHYKSVKIQQDHSTFQTNYLSTTTITTRVTKSLISARSTIQIYLPFYFDSHQPHHTLQHKYTSKFRDNDFVLSLFYETYQPGPCALICHHFHFKELRY